MKGTFKARGVKCEPGKSATKGTEQVSGLFRIEGSGEEVRWTGYFTEKTTQRTIDSLLYCGWDGNDYVMFTGFDKNIVEIVVEEEDYTHPETGVTTTRSRVAWVNDPNRTVGGKPMNAGELTDFASRMKGHVLAAKEKAAKQAPGAVGPKF